MVNELVAAGSPGELAGRRRIPYASSRRASATLSAMCAPRFRERFSSPRGALRSPNVAALGRLLAGGRDAAHGELLSYLFFEGEFADALIELGRMDARRWLEDEHDDGLWQLGQLPVSGAAGEAGLGPGHSHD